MRKVWYIAAREYLASVRSKSFLITLLLLPLLMAGGGLAQRALRGRVDLEPKKVLVADGTGRLLPQLIAAAAARNRSEAFEGGRQVEALFAIEAGPAVLDDAQRMKLSERVRKRELHAFAEIEVGALEGRGAARFHSESAVSSSLNRWFARALATVANGERLRAAGIDPALVARATAAINVDGLGLYSLDQDGQIKKADRGSRTTAFLMPIAVMVLMFMALMMSQTLLQGTLEEKQQKIAEVLLGSVRPSQLMWGKLLGSVGVSLTTIGLYLVASVWTLGRMGYAGMLRSDMVAWMLLFQVLGVLIYGSVFATIGALCSDLKDAQSYLMPVMMVLVAPMMIWFRLLEEPTGAFAVGLSLVPVWTPMLMPLRLAATEAIPLWQPLLGAGGSLLLTAGCVWLGGRIFRLGLLLQGKPPRLGQLLRWAVRG